MPPELPLLPLTLIRQGVACGLLLLLSARLPSRVLAVVTAVARHPAVAVPMAVAGPAEAAHQPIGAALVMLGLDGFGVLCATYLCHGRLRGVPLLRCYPPQRLIPLSLHLLGVLWGLLNLALPGQGSGL